MTHPSEETLTDFIDDTLAAAERKRVDRHVATCQACSTSLAAASRARQALSALGEVPVPAGVISPVIREAGSSTDRGEDRSPRMGTRNRARTSGPRSKTHLRRGAIAKMSGAIAAVLIAVGVVAGLNHDSRPATDSAAMASQPPPEAFMSPASGEPGLDRDGDLNAAEMKVLATKTAAVYGGKGHEAVAASASPVAVQGSTGSAGGPTADTAPAKAAGTGYALAPKGTAISDPASFDRCLSDAGVFDHGGTLIGAFQATYVGDPAWFAVLTEGPSAGKPADRAVVWAFSPKGCDLLGFSEAPFPSATPSPLPTSFMHP